MNIISESKWIECKKPQDLVINDPKNPFLNIGSPPLFAIGSNCIS